MNTYIWIITLLICSFMALTVGYKLGRAMEQEQQEINREVRDRYMEQIRYSMRRHPSYRLRAVKDAQK